MYFLILPSELLNPQFLFLSYLVLAEDVEKWLIENVGIGGSVLSRKYLERIWGVDLWQAEWYYGKVRICFKNELDAINFKLRWL